ncbi:MAG: response regulator [Myxococcota bacterium]
MANILIADDDSHIREVVRFALERAGHRVVEASDGAEALSSFQNDAPDLIVLDIVMPEQDGLDVCRRIRESSNIPILFLSSRDEELDRILGLELGGDDYVTKPFSPRELVARVKAMLRRVAVQLKAARSLMGRAAEIEVAGGNADSLASMAKLVASDAAVEISLKGMQLMGGTGYARASAMQRLFRDGRLWGFSPLNNEMVRNRLGEGWLGLPRSY